MSCAKTKPRASISVIDAIKNVFIGICWKWSFQSGDWLRAYHDSRDANSKGRFSHEGRARLRRVISAPREYTVRLCA